MRGLIDMEWKGCESIIHDHDCDLWVPWWGGWMYRKVTGVIRCRRAGDISSFLTKHNAVWTMCIFRTVYWIFFTVGAFFLPCSIFYMTEVVPYLPSPDGLPHLQTVDTGHTITNTLPHARLYAGDVKQFYWIVASSPLTLSAVYWADSRFVPSQWETALLCNDVSHWLGASLESVLSIYTKSVRLLWS